MTGRHKIGDRWRVPDPLPESLGHLCRNSEVEITYVHHASENGQQQVCFYQAIHNGLRWGGHEWPIDAMLLHDEMGWIRVS